ncbi:MAG: hypothetical protein AAF889_04195 [Cyanobacteria bacterium P01_D01_bin.73]
MRLSILNPAKAIVLDGDRGSLEIGKQTDFISAYNDGTISPLSSIYCRRDRIA